MVNNKDPGFTHRYGCVWFECPTFIKSMVCTVILAESVVEPWSGVAWKMVIRDISSKAVLRRRLWETEFGLMLPVFLAQNKTD